MSSNTFQIAGRVYHFTGSQVVSIYYRVINPKTGFEWQGIKHDKKIVPTVYSLSNWKTEEKSGVVEGQIPSNWDEAGKWNSATSGFRSVEEAIEVIKARHINAEAAA